MNWGSGKLANKKRRSPCKQDRYDRREGLLQKRTRLHFKPPSKNQPAGLELHKQRVHMLCGPSDAGYRMAGG